MKISCSACGGTVEQPDRIGFRDTCPSCDAYLHSCVNCRFWIKDQCTEPSAEKMRDPEGQNYCDWYREIDINFTDEKEKAGEREAAEELWRKLTKK